MCNTPTVIPAPPVTVSWQKPQYFNIACSCFRDLEITFLLTILLQC